MLNLRIILDEKWIVSVQDEKETINNLFNAIKKVTGTSEGNRLFYLGYGKSIIPNKVVVIEITKVAEDKKDESQI